MDYVELIGLAAALLTTASFVPQLVRVIRTRSAKDISLAMYLAFIAGIALWLVYGLLISSLPIILANAVTLALACAILGLKIAYG